MTRSRGTSRTARATGLPRGAVRGLELQARANWTVALDGGLKIESASDLRALLQLHPFHWTPLEAAGWAAAPSADGGGGCPELYWLMRDRLIAGQALLDLRHRECRALGITDAQLQDRFVQSIEGLRGRFSKASLQTGSGPDGARKARRPPPNYYSSAQSVIEPSRPSPNAISRGNTRAERKPGRVSPVNVDDDSSLPTGFVYSENEPGWSSSHVHDTFRPRREDVLSSAESSEIGSNGSATGNMATEEIQMDPESSSGSEVAEAHDAEREVAFSGQGPRGQSGEECTFPEHTLDLAKSCGENGGQTDGPLPLSEVRSCTTGDLAVQDLSSAEPRQVHDESGDAAMAKPKGPAELQEENDNAITNEPEQNDADDKEGHPGSTGGSAFEAECPWRPRAASAETQTCEDDFVEDPAPSTAATGGLRRSSVESILACPPPAKRGTSTRSRRLVAPPVASSRFRQCSLGPGEASRGPKGQQADWVGRGSAPIHASQPRRAAQVLVLQTAGGGWRRSYLEPQDPKEEEEEEDEPSKVLLEEPAWVGWRAARRVAHPRPPQAASTVTVKRRVQNQAPHQWTFDAGHPTQRGADRRAAMRLEWVSQRPKWTSPTAKPAEIWCQTGPNAAGRRVGNELHRLAAAGRAADIKRFLEKPPRGRSPAVLVREGNAAAQTPLHKATAFVHPPEAMLAMVEGLVRMGADVDAADCHGRTALLQVVQLWHSAAQTYHPVAESLLAKGANVNAQDADGETPLHKVVLSYRSSAFGALAGLLLREGADPEVRNWRGWTPLHMACSRGLNKAASVLIAGGADVDAQDVSQRTPLHLSAAFCEDQSRCCMLVQELLDWGANNSIPDKSGLTAGDIARLRSLERLSGILPPGKSCDNPLVDGGEASEVACDDVVHHAKAHSTGSPKPPATKPGTPPIPRATGVGTGEGKGPCEESPPVRLLSQGGPKDLIEPPVQNSRYGKAEDSLTLSSIGMDENEASMSMDGPEEAPSTDAGTVQPVFLSERRTEFGMVAESRLGCEETQGTGSLPCPKSSAKVKAAANVDGGGADLAGANGPPQAEAPSATPASNEVPINAPFGDSPASAVPEESRVVLASQQPREDLGSSPEVEQQQSAECVLGGHTAIPFDTEESTAEGNDQRDPQEAHSTAVTGTAEEFAAAEAGVCQPHQGQEPGAECAACGEANAEASTDDAVGGVKDQVPDSEREGCNGAAEERADHAERRQDTSSEEIIISSEANMVSSGEDGHDTEIFPSKVVGAYIPPQPREETSFDSERAPSLDLEQRETAQSVSGASGSAAAFSLEGSETHLLQDEEHAEQAGLGSASIDWEEGELPDDLPSDLLLEDDEEESSDTAMDSNKYRTPNEAPVEAARWMGN